MAFKLGLQVYTVRDDASKNFADTMKKIKEMGYDGVELAGDYGHSASYIKEVLADVGLEIISAHVPIAQLYDESEKTFAFYKELDCKFVVIPWLDENSRPGKDAFLDVIKKVRVIGENAKKNGMQLLYHNHDFEFVKIDGVYGLDYLYNSVPAEFLQTELDTCWINIGGENPAEYVKKYSGRTPVVHLKDFFKDENASKDGMYELIGIAKKANENNGFEFRAVGHGMQDIPSIIEASAQAGASWLIVEQDRPSQGLTPMESADISIKYLRSIGL